MFIKAAGSFELSTLDCPESVITASQVSLILALEGTKH
jgi:hypothetical protein